MLRILDRYVLRELMAPFGLALLLLTFALEIPPILQHGEALIAEGASWDIVVRVLATLVPQALGITIPMALLVGILIALGRLSGDREIVAMEACGVSLGRLLRPLLLFGVDCDGRDDLRHDRRAAGRKSSVPRDHLQAADDARRNEDQTARVLHGVSESRHLCSRSDARRRLDRRDGVREQHADAAEALPGEDGAACCSTKRSARCRWCSIDGTHHSVNLDEPEKYEAGTFAQTTLVIDPESVFPREGPDEGLHGDDHRRAEGRDGRASQRRTSTRTTRSWRGRRNTRFRRPASPSCWSRSGWASATAATAGSPASSSASASCSSTGC